MGALIRSIDWSTTPLGPVSAWSQALRTTVGLLLRSGFPQILWWGPQFIQFYNDPYRPIPGDKHPTSMGQPASVCWSEVWHLIGPMIEAPFSGQPATTNDDLFAIMNRKGFMEETHFKVAYSPVPDETIQPTGVGGVLGTIAETTEQVYGERQLKTLRELGAREVEAKTAEEACRTAAVTFTKNPFDVPFALFYLLELDGKGARLAAQCGFTGSGRANAERIDLADSRSKRGWPLRRVAEKGVIEVTPNLGQRFEEALPCGYWPDPPHTAIALPLASPDQPRPYGVLIAGVNPRRELTEGYRTFFELAASQVTTAIRNALAFEEQRKRAEALAEIDRAKTIFFSNVSHEFRTPLTLLLGPLEEALDPENTALPAQDRERLTLAHRNAYRLMRLVNTLLDFSRIEAGRAEAVYEPTDLAAYTAALASVFRSAIERAGMELIVDCPPLPEPLFHF
jgi:GAF domain-containing protein